VSTVADSAPGAPHDPASAAGLTAEEARRRLARGGANAIVDVAPHPVRQALEKLWAPIPWMLEAAILLALGLREYPEAAVIGLLLAFNAVLGVVQEARSAATLDALKTRLALNAQVKRDGRWITAPAAALVAGDVVNLTLGAVVPADVRLLAGAVLIDESMLTGESLAVEAGPGFDAYAGALVRRGAALAVVTATGERTKFGRTAELIRTAAVESTQQKTIFGVVRNLVIFNGTVTVMLTAYALRSPMPRAEIVPLVLVAILASIPVALPSMFTLAAAIGARSLAGRGVLPTRLSAVDEAAGIDVFCSDKTGTLTCNELAVVSVHAFAPYDEAHVLALAGLASSVGDADPVDAAIRRSASRTPVAGGPTLVSFVPFDPQRKRSEAIVRETGGDMRLVVKGAFSVIAALVRSEAAAAALVDHLEASGCRVLAVAAGTSGELGLIGVIALSDPPRDDAAALVARLAELGVRTVMVTGDAPATARFVATAVGITGEMSATTPLPPGLRAEAFAIFAGVLPEDKFRLVKALQRDGHIVGVGGDGANDAPALRQAQMGIAVSTATDVAKSAAGIVLTEPGLGGVVTAVTEGRTTFQRILTYTLRSITHKVNQVLFLAAGLGLTGHAILTPTLMVLMMVMGDFLAMSSSTDNVRPSRKPSIWHVRNLTLAGTAMGAADLLFCVACLWTAKFAFSLDTAALQTFAVVTLVFSGQAVLYVSREREHLWSSVPSRWLLLSSIADVSVVAALAARGIFMQALPLTMIAGVFIAATTFAFLLDVVKLAMFRRFAVG
jgi:H+-transporting ATPase